MTNPYPKEHNPYDPNLIYYEGIEVGAKIKGEPTYLVTPDEIKEFATRFDPMPFHMDEEKAKITPYGALTAPACLTQCILINLLHRTLPPLAGIGLVGIENVTLPRAVFAGDILHLETEITHKRLSKSNPTRGLITNHFKLMTSTEELVYSSHHIQIFLVKPK